MGFEGIRCSQNVYGFTWLWVPSWALKRVARRAVCLIQCITWYLLGVCPNVLSKCCRGCFGARVIMKKLFSRKKAKVCRSQPQLAFPGPSEQFHHVPHVVASNSFRSAFFHSVFPFGTLRSDVCLRICFVATRN